MSDVVLHYFSLGSLGRGEVVRVFLRELKIDFEDKKYTYDATWPAVNDSTVSSLTGKLPLLEIDGHRLSQHLSILRYLARRAGHYDGETNYEKYFVDALSDIYNDWRTGWVAQLSAKDPEYKVKHVEKFYNYFTEFYNRDTSGPYLLGSRPTYVDFAVFQALDNDASIGCAPASLSKPLQDLNEAITNRPNIKQYLAERAAN